jgi:light-regulated signal transduction histidine kinase (bacteriophytochrome)
MNMGNSEQSRRKEEIEVAGEALDAQKLRCLDAERRLDQANAHFEEFVSIAAHNLREPLRDVASSSQMMAESCAGRLDSDAEALLRRIQEDAGRMESLLAAMVDYWATGVGDGPPARTDMEAVLRQALLCAEKQLTERGAIVTHDALPAVLGDFPTLARVLRHLIRNAVEYSGAATPRVHISSKRVGLESVFSVEDNGPGIDPAFHGRIFEVFRRLHGKEHPGNGLGLAFCRRAIERHGGRMWLESAAGAGSTFSFSLPAAD